MRIFYTNQHFYLHCISRILDILIIAHRLSTIKKVGKIIVLEEGSYIELARAQGGLYAKLLKLQELGMWSE